VSPARVSVKLFLLCLLLGIAAPLGAQTGGGAWVGTVFTPALDSVTQTGGSAFLPVFRTEASYDSNVLSSQTAQLSTYFLLMEGEGKYSYRGEGDTVELIATGGERVYPMYTHLDSYVADGRFQWQHNFSKRSYYAVTARWASLPEGTVEEGNPNQTLTQLGSSALSANFLEQRVETRLATIYYTYSLSRRTSFVVGGNYNETQLEGLQLINTEENDAYGGLQYQVNHAQSFGLMYAHQWLYFSRGFAASQIDDALGTYEYKLSANTNFSAFGGPARVSLAPGVETQSSPNGGTSTTTAAAASISEGAVGGAVMNVGVGRNKLRAEYTRLVTGGSGFLATVQQQTGSLTLSRNVTRHVEIGVLGAYSDNIEIGVANTAFRTFYVEPSLRYSLSRHFRISIRGSAGQVSGLSQYGTLIRDQLTVQLEYKFPELTLGR